MIHLNMGDIIKIQDKRLCSVIWPYISNIPLGLVKVCDKTALTFAPITATIDITELRYTYFNRLTFIDANRQDFETVDEMFEHIKALHPSFTRDSEVTVAYFDFIGE